MAEAECVAAAAARGRRARCVGAARSGWWVRCRRRQTRRACRWTACARRPALLRCRWRRCWASAGRRPRGLIAAIDAMRAHPTCRAQLQGCRAVASIAGAATRWKSAPRRRGRCVLRSAVCRRQRGQSGMMSHSRPRDQPRLDSPTLSPRLRLPSRGPRGEASPRGCRSEAAVALQCRPKSTDPTPRRPC